MMKKLFSIISLCVVSLLGGCEAGWNKQILDINYKFTKVHIIEAGKCFEIESWNDFENSDQLQVKIKDYGSCLFHASEIVLVVDKCPICGE